jgi:pimeloyl-ACP methyl ester carboxylesterase
MNRRFVVGLALLASLLGCSRPGVGPSAQPLGCRWSDVDVYADHPNAEQIAEMDAGTVVAAEHIQHIEAVALSLSASMPVAFGAEVYRILYVAVIDGAAQLVSARIALPDATGPDAPVAMVAHQHGTFGFGDGCAPSAVPGFGFEGEVNPNAAWALSQNYAVVMTDYAGLGTPGTHPYVARRPTGTAVLDGILALQGFCDDSRGVATIGALPTVLEGHSQGAHATVAALTLVDERPEEFDIRGAVALALPAEHDRLIRHMVTTGDVAGALGVMGIAGQIHARPEVYGRYSDWFLPDIAEWWSQRGDQACAPEMSVRFGLPASMMMRPEIMTAIADGDFASLGVAEALVDESLANISSQVPLLVIHGGKDMLIPVDIIEDLAAQWPAEIATLEVWPNEDHWVLPSIVRARTFAFLSDHLQ